MSRVSALLVMVLFAAACGSSPVASGPTPTVPHTPKSTSTAPTTAASIPDPLRAQMRVALQAWSKFPVNSSNRPLVLTTDPVSAPPYGFPTGDAKEAFLTGLFVAPAALPPGPQDADGYPVMAAAQALAVMRAEGRPAIGASHTPASLVITNVRFGTSSFGTERGTRTLPAWLFSFAGVQNPAAVLAVAPSARFAPPAGEPASVGGRLGSGPTITVIFTGAQPGPGPCSADYTVFQLASATAVAVLVQEKNHASTGANVVCSDVGYSRRAVITLAAPLGNRVLIDAKTKGPIPIAP